MRTNGVIRSVGGAKNCSRMTCRRIPRKMGCLAHPKARYVAATSNLLTPSHVVVSHYPPPPPQPVRPPVPRHLQTFRWLAALSLSCALESRQLSPQTTSVGTARPVVTRVARPVTCVVSCIAGFTLAPHHNKPSHCISRHVPLLAGRHSISKHAKLLCLCDLDSALVLRVPWAGLYRVLKRQIGCRGVLRVVEACSGL